MIWARLLSLTQYFSPYGNDADQLLIRIKDLTDHLPITCEAADSGEMAIFVKSHTMGSAVGHVVPMVVFDADNLDEDMVITEKSWLITYSRAKCIWLHFIYKHLGRKFHPDSFRIHKCTNIPCTLIFMEILTNICNHLSQFQMF